MLEGSIVEFSHRGVFELHEANGLVGVLNRITKKHSERVNVMFTQLENMDEHHLELTVQIEELINKEIAAWNTKVRKLGAIPRGMWYVDLQCSHGYFTWQYHENEIRYWHDHQSHYSNRILLSHLKAQESCVNHYREVKNNDSFK